MGSDSAVGRHNLSKAPLALLAAPSCCQQVVPCSRNGAPARAPQEDSMPMFIMSLGWTDQGIRSVKDAPKRSKAARDLAKKVGVDIKEVYLTSGDSDLLLIVDTPNGDNVAKFALALGALGNVRSRTARAWPEPDFQKLISELP